MLSFLRPNKHLGIDAFLQLLFKLATFLLSEQSLEGTSAGFNVLQQWINTNLDGTRVFEERENNYTCFRAFKNDSTPLRDSKSFFEALVSVE